MKRNYLIVLFFCIFLLHLSSFAQDTLNIEKKFEIAQSYAFEGQRDTARILLYQILAKKPDFIDAKLLIARTHAWDNDYDSARYIYRQVLIKKPGYKEAIEGLIDVEVWDKNPDTAIYYCNYGLKYNPKEKDFIIRKAKIYLDKGNTDEAYKQLMIVKAKDSANEEVIKLLDDERFIFQNDKIQGEYTHEWFDEPYKRRWSLYSFSYQNKSSWGTFVGRIYSGNIKITSDSSNINDNGFQFEAEAYPKLDNKHYLYLGFGLSPDYFFPKTRFGAEIYRKLNNQAEISLGFRHLNFDNSNTPIKKVTIYTASYSKYIKDFWISARAYYTNMSEVTSWTYAFQGRKYFNNQETYVFAELIFGSSASEQSFVVDYSDPSNPIKENYLLTSQKFRFGFQKLIWKRWTFYAAYSVEDAEYNQDANHLINSIEFRLGYYLPYGK